MGADARKAVKKKERELWSIMSSNSVLNFTNEKIVEKKNVRSRNNTLIIYANSNVYKLCINFIVHQQLLKKKNTDEYINPLSKVFSPKNSNL